MGAQRGELRRLVIRQGGRLAAVGLGAGLAVSLLVSRFLHSTLYGVSERDWTVYTAAITLTAGAALLACWAPAARAARVEPSAALRED
jgi:putative ABC transport system permease protein